MTQQRLARSCYTLYCGRSQRREKFSCFDGKKSEDRMDQRVWQWRSPWEKRTYIFCSLFYLCLLLRQQVTAAETGYSQDSKSDATDSNKLDSFSSYLPYDSREFDSEYKRGSAFFPLRGKKQSDDDSLDSDDKRSQFFPLRGKKVPDDLKRASYFMPMRGRKDGSWADEDYDITDESPDKRASSFMPMRGKKKYAAISDFLTKAGTYDSGALNPSSYRTSGKRMHSFVPVRGKRSSEDPSSADESSNHTALKRSVSFMPMRGRREEAGTPGGIATSLLEKKMQAFMPMRGRKDGGEVGEEFDDVEKKAKFMPMRGRKDGSELGDGFSDLEKKAKFMPMRGRKDGSEDDSMDKKATFMPMRGRKDDDYEDMDEYKRAQSFMPMRGRRAQLRDVVFESSNAPGIESRLIEDKRASSFMPMRGRRSVPDDEDISDDDNDADKRMAFMPMRGRRLSDDDVEVEPWPADHLISLLDKRSSAFMPMRGRRFDYRNITVDPWQPDQLMSLFDNKRSSAFMPMRGRRFSDYYRNITVDPWPADQLMSLFDSKRSSAFMPMRGRRDYDDPSESHGWDKRGSYFTPMRGRRFDSLLGRSFYNPYPYLMAGMGSSLMSKPYSDQGVSYQSVGSADERRKKLRINWDSVKRAFHATRGKRRDDSSDNDPVSSDSERPARTKRSIMRQRIAMQPSRQYIALKRPMSFFATRGKRLDDSTLDKLSKLR